MIKLTNAEKAARYDALQAAIKFTIEIYRKRVEDNCKESKIAGMLGAYHKGLADGFKLALEDLERWADS